MKQQEDNAQIGLGRDELLRELWQRFCPNEPLELTIGESGMNNVTVMGSSRGERFVLRVYNNYGNMGAVNLEHEMLDKLGQLPDLPFFVPRPLANEAGETVAALSDGRAGAVFRYIEGVRPSATSERDAFQLGEAAGRLINTMKDIKLNGKPQYSPYHAFAASYAAMTGERLVSLADASPLLAGKREELAAIQLHREEAERQCPEAAALPQQWIHGDLVFNNSLSDGSRITGILDFEFVTVDCRAMELAVLVVDLMKPWNEGAAQGIHAVIQGFGSQVSLNKKELRLLPVLVKLRLLDVALHFAIRFADRIDSDEVLACIIDDTIYGLDWLAKYSILPEG
ncbi:phosphotransferase [Paenibacillus sp. CAU 1782]